MGSIPEAAAVLFGLCTLFLCLGWFCPGSPASFHLPEMFTVDSLTTLTSLWVPVAFKPDCVLLGRDTCFQSAVRVAQNEPRGFLFQLIMYRTGTSFSRVRPQKSQAAHTSSLEDTCLVPLGFDYNIYRPAYDKLSAMLSGSLGFVMAAWQFITL